MKLGALRAALAAKLARRHAGGRRHAAPATRQEDQGDRGDAEALGATGKTLVIDVAHDEAFTLSARNIAGVTLVASGRVTARDVMDTDRVIATRAALEKLQESLG